MEDPKKINPVPAFGFAGKEIKMAALGLILGTGLIAFSVATDIIFRNISFELASVSIIYRENVTHWIILTSPLVLAAIFFAMAKMVRRKELVIQTTLQGEKYQSQLLENFISQLQQSNFTVALPDEFRNKEVRTRLDLFKKKLAQDKRNEEQRSWENKGLATFGELLRKETDNDNLSFEILRFIIKYLDCNQGTLFLIDAAGQNLELKSCFAYDKKKFVSNSIPIGQGLVGQCYLERETILLYDVPKDYIKITSGLGMATPTCVVIAPLKYNEKVLGVIEVASFYRLENFQISFLEKCAEAFTSVVQNVLVNLNVKQLLHTSQQQTEELRSQEEEMRQNMEELQTIQEQITRQLEENTTIKNLLEARESVLAQTTILSESDLFGTITFINPKFTAVSGYSSVELIGKGHNTVRHPDMPKELFRKMWTTIKTGRTFRGIVKNRKKDGSHYWVDATIVPILENGKVVKYIGARYHITDDAIAEKLFELQMEQMQIQEMIAA
jgi:PAS domain S-box-containing protein